MKIGYLMQAGVPDVRQLQLSGPANHVKHIFNELHKLGHKTKLLAFLDGQIWQSENLEDFTPVTLSLWDKKPIRLLESAIRRIQSELHLPYVALFESLRFASACQQVLSGYDVFYERMGWVGYGGVWASKRLGIPLVYEVNGDHLRELESLGMLPSKIQIWLSIFFVKWAVQGASHVVATGAGWRQSFLDRWGTSPEVVTVIENGSDIVCLLPRNRLRAFSKIVPSTTTILYVGAFEPWHGISFLLKALARAISCGNSLRLILIGAGSCEAELRQMVDELNLGEYVIFTGYISTDEIAEIMTQADIGVSPYCERVEYSGLKLLDYKSAGLAVIASGEGGQPAVLKHGYTGWIVSPCDEVALSDAIIHLSNDTDLRQKLGQQARLEAESYHSWMHTAVQLEQLFQLLVKKSSG